MRDSIRNRDTMRNIGYNFIFLINKKNNRQHLLNQVKENKIKK